MSWQVVEAPKRVNGKADFRVGVSPQGGKGRLRVRIMFGPDVVKHGGLAYGMAFQVSLGTGRQAGKVRLLRAGAKDGFKLSLTSHPNVLQLLFPAPAGSAASKVVEVEGELIEGGFIVTLPDFVGAADCGDSAEAGCVSRPADAHMNQAQGYVPPGEEESACGLVYAQGEAARAEPASAPSRDSASEQDTQEDNYWSLSPETEASFGKGERLLWSVLRKVGKVAGFAELGATRQPQPYPDNSVTSYASKLNRAIAPDGLRLVYADKTYVVEVLPEEEEGDTEEEEKRSTEACKADPALQAQSSVYTSTDAVKGPSARVAASPLTASVEVSPGPLTLDQIATPHDIAAYNFHGLPEPLYRALRTAKPVLRKYFAVLHFVKELNALLAPFGLAVWRDGETFSLREVTA